MKALSVRQPWSWLILHAGKDVENRTWTTRFRGRFLLHAAKGMTRPEWLAAMGFAQHIAGSPVEVLQRAPYEQLERGGIVGSVELVDCVASCDSPWYMGRVAFVLRDPRPLPFIACKGALNFFEVPDELLSAAGVRAEDHR